VLRTLRWLARNSPVAEVLCRRPTTRGFVTGPAVARPWRMEPDAALDTLRLYANAPGFDETLRHSLARQPRDLDKIGCPVLLLWGGLDVLLLPRQGRRFERLIPDCELRYLQGLGHMPMSDDPQLLAGAISEFATKRSRAPRAAAPV
jgi:pimeloyl-ACP methyl ester carboxylesterase